MLVGSKAASTTLYNVVVFYLSISKLPSRQKNDNFLLSLGRAFVYFESQVR